MWNPNVFYRINCRQPFSQSWVRSIQSMLFHPSSWRSILILPSHLLRRPGNLFSSGFHTKTLYTPVLIHIRTKCPAHLFLFVLTTEWYLVRSVDHEAPHTSWSKLSIKKKKDVSKSFAVYISCYNVSTFNITRRYSVFWHVTPIYSVSGFRCFEIRLWFEGCLTVHLPHEITWNANLTQQGNFIDVLLARHVSGTYAHHQEH